MTKLNWTGASWYLRDPASVIHVNSEFSRPLRTQKEDSDRREARKRQSEEKNKIARQGNAEELKKRYAFLASQAREKQARGISLTPKERIALRVCVDMQS